MKRKTESHPDVMEIDWAVAQELQCTITPESAKLILEDYNERNRRLRPKTAREMAQLILRGEWNPRHNNAIAFTAHGLQDGQHRITAIVESGCTVVARCSFGHAESERQYIDTGTSRTLSDRLEFVEDAVLNATLGALVGKIHQMGKSGFPASGRIAPQDALALFARRREALVKVAELNKRRKCVGKMEVAAAFVDYFERVGEPALAMYHSLFLVDGPVQQARVLREFLFRTPHLPRLHVYEFSLGACYAHMMGREIKALRRRESL